MRISVSAALCALLIVLLLTCVEIAQPPADLKPKVFVIGLSKTGTTSLGDALHMLGYKRLGWKDIRSRQLVQACIHGDLAPIVEQTKYYDAFEDLPWPYLYREMAELYPDARFILSLRRDDQTWLRSMERHLMRGRWSPYAHFYGADVYPGNEEMILQSYQNHTQTLRAFFGDKPHRFLEIVVDDGDANWAALIRFLGNPSDDLSMGAFPKSNTAAHWQTGLELTDQLHWLWRWIITTIEEQSSSWMYEKRQASVRAVLTLLWKAIDVVEQACSELYYHSGSAGVSWQDVLPSSRLHSKATVNTTIPQTPPPYFN
nr:hypothetical protein B0A51_18792 [Rachicladosporium sp. CCFEE 5018]